MKTTDLRINNHVQLIFPDGEITAVVEGVKRGMIALDVNGRIGWYDSTSINPIPLTEQWLFDLGFEKYTGRYGVYYKHYALEGFRVWLPRDIYGWGYTVGRKDFETGDTYWVKNEVRYVHQLQNLYFALMQEEIKLKDK